MESKLKIPILDLKPGIHAHAEEFCRVVTEVIEAGHFILGENVAAFEKEIASFLGSRHAIGVNSGTDALIIGLRAAGVSQGDEVITSPFTFFATAEAISIIGAIPVFVDIDPETFNLDCSLIKAKLTRKTKAILPVHLFGHTAEMGEILATAKERGIMVVEDVAQAFGAEYMGKKAGTLGAVGAFSFFPSKNLGAFGDAGAVVTNDDKIAEVARMLRSHGSKQKYFNEMLGYNSRLDEIQAAILRVKLRYVAEENEQRREAASRYRELFAEVDCVQCPIERKYCKHVYHQYTIRIKGNRRDAIREKLEEAGISTMVYYPFPLNQLPLYRSGDSYSRADDASREVLSLPLWPQIALETQCRVARELVAGLDNIPKRWTAVCT